jgi:hypothetical protein
MGDLCTGTRTQPGISFDKALDARIPDERAGAVETIKAKMKHDSSSKSTVDQPRLSSDKTSDDYLDALDPEVRSSFTETQLEALRRLLEAAVPRSAPKLVDLRFWIDLLAYRFYIVLFIGKDRRRHERYDSAELASRKGNAIAAILLLLGFNLIISVFILLLALLIKSLIDYSLFPEGH